MHISRKSETNLEARKENISKGRFHSENYKKFDSMWKLFPKIDIARKRKLKQLKLWLIRNHQIFWYYTNSKFWFRKNHFHGFSVIPRNLFGIYYLAMKLRHDVIKPLPSLRGFFSSFKWKSQRSQLRLSYCSEVCMQHSNSTQLINE